MNEVFAESDVYDAEGNIQWNKIKEFENIVMKRGFCVYLCILRSRQVKVVESAM